MKERRQPQRKSWQHFVTEPQEQKLIVTLIVLLAMFIQLVYGG